MHRGLEGTGWGTGAVGDGRVLAGPIHQEAERESGLVLILYSQLESLVQSEIPAPGMVPHTFKLVFPLWLVLCGTTDRGTLRGMSKPSQGTKRLTIAATS